MCFRIQSVKLKGQQEKACLVKPLRRAATEAGTSAKPPSKAAPQVVTRALSLVRFLALRCRQGLHADHAAEGAEGEGREDGETAGEGEGPTTAGPAETRIHHQVPSHTNTLQGGGAIHAPWSHRAALQSLHSLQRRLARLRITPISGDQPEGPGEGDGRLNVSLNSSLSKASSIDTTAATLASQSAPRTAARAMLSSDSFDCVLVSSAQDSPMLVTGPERRSRAASAESEEYVVVPR